MNFAEYRIVENGITICDPCVCVTLFSENDLGVENAPEMMGPYFAFLELFQGQMAYCRTDGDQMHPKRVTTELLQKFSQQMYDLKRRKKGGILVELRGGDSPDGRKAPSFDFGYSKVGRPHSFVRASFPLIWFETEGIAGIERYLEKSLKGFSMTTGYVGFSFSWDGEAERTLEPYFLRWLIRHPGIMAPGLSQRAVAYSGLTDIGWITLLATDSLAAIGGLSELKKHLSDLDQITIASYPNGVAGIRIGDAPRLGDTQNGDNMEDYRALGKLLSPLRNREAIINGMSVTGIRDRDHPGLRAKWIDRFFPA